MFASLSKLALGNVRKSLRDFAVYFVTLVLGVAMFYAFNTITDQADFLSSETSALLAALGVLVEALTVMLALVLGFLVVYANNYLVRRRKRELGLYQVLGMRRGQVSLVLTLETLMVALASFVVGIAVGVLLSQLLVFVTAALFQDRVTYFEFRFSTHAFAITLACFAVMLLFNLRTIRRVKLVDLLRADRVNEQVKTRSLPFAVLIFAIACALIGVAYARLLRDGLPIADLGGSATRQFYLTTGLVTAGTFLLFYGLSSFLLGLVQRLRPVYWRGLNMFTLRQLSARINTASVSMAVIAMILFLAITSVTGGMSICTTINENLRLHVPFDASSCVVYLADAAEETGNAAVAPAATGDLEAAEQHDAIAQMAAAGYDVTDIGRAALINLFSADAVSSNPSGFFGRVMAAESGALLPLGLENSLSDTMALDVMPLSDFNAHRALLNLEPYALEGDTYLIATDMGSLEVFYTDVLARGYTVEVGGRTLSPASAEVVSDQSASVTNSSFGSNGGIVVVPDDLLEAFEPYTGYINVLYDVPSEEGNAFMAEFGAVDTSTILVDETGARYAFINGSYTHDEAYAESAGMSGIVSYMAIYIGFVLVIACAAILAIQQLSEANDSQGRYRLLAELGCPTGLALRSLLVQVLVYFLAPLVVALAHSFVALRVVVDLVALFGHLEITAAATIAGAIFVVSYGGYLFVTYRVARSLVRQGMLGVRREG